MSTLHWSTIWYLAVAWPHYGQCFECCLFTTSNQDSCEWLALQQSVEWWPKGVNWHTHHSAECQYHSDVTACSHACSLVTNDDMLSSHWNSWCWLATWGTDVVLLWIFAQLLCHHKVLLPIQCDTDTVKQTVAISLDIHKHITVKHSRWSMSHQLLCIVTSRIVVCSDSCWQVVYGKRCTVLCLRLMYVFVFWMLKINNSWHLLYLSLICGWFAIFRQTSFLCSNSGEI